MSQREPRDTEEYTAIWERRIVDGVPTKVYVLTKRGMDILETAPTQEDLEEVHKRFNDLVEVVKPLILTRLKDELLTALGKESHKAKTLMLKIPKSGFFTDALIEEALAELVKEGKAVQEKWGWHKKIQAKTE